MTILDTFVSFARELPADRLESVEVALAALMESYSERHDFTESEVAELDRRVVKARPAFADPAEITSLIRHPGLVPGSTEPQVMPAEAQAQTQPQGRSTSGSAAR